MRKDVCKIGEGRLQVLPHEFTCLRRLCGGLYDMFPPVLFPFPSCLPLLLYCVYINYILHGAFVAIGVL